MTTAARGRLTADKRLLALQPGATEVVKIGAVALMVGDHVNKYLLSGRADVLYDAGRIAFPLFALVFAFNLARPGFFDSQAPQRILARLVLAALVASVPFVALGHLLGGWWPLNILFTLGSALGVLMLWRGQGFAAKGLAVAVFLVSGGFVEFWWPGVGLVLSGCAYFRSRSAVAAIAAAVCLAMLCWINNNAWALASVPLLAAAASWDCRSPGLPRWAFYAVYPGHLAVLWAAQAVMS